MEKNRLLLTILILGIGFIAIMGTAAAQQGTIEGYVKKSDGTLVGDTRVKLEVFEGTQEIDSVSTQTNQDGYYEFNDLNKSMNYRVTAFYNNTTFQAPGTMHGIFLFGEKDTITKNITVFEEAGSSSNLEISSYHIIITKNDQTNNLNITQILRINNTGSEPFRGQISIDAPENVTTETGSEVEKNNVTISLDPGENVIKRFFYLAPLGESFRFNLNLDLKTQTLLLLLEPQSVNGTKPQNLIDAGVREQFGGYHVYTTPMGSSLPTGSEIGLTITPTSQTNATPQEGGDNLLIPAILAAALVIGFIAYTNRDKLGDIDITGSDKERSVELSGEEKKRLERRKKSLLKKIDKLDSEYEQGEISQSDYDKKRSSYKDDLTSVMKKLESAEMAIETKEETEQVKDEKTELENEKEKLLEKIDNLEERLEKGEISEEEHEILNERYREKLKDVMEKLED